MVFSSPFFLFVFLPLTVIPYLLLRNWKYKNIILLIASLAFYIFGEGELVLLMLVSIIANFYFGKFIEKKQTKTALGIGLTFNILILVVNKYTGFIIESVNAGLEIFNLETLPIPNIKLPVGISFYTFQSISYLIDVYRREHKAQKSLADLALYISLFPQLIAGPIVRYKDVAAQIIKRKTESSMIFSGIQRFVMGLSKKVLIANTFGLTTDLIFEIPIAEQTMLVSWLGIICYSIQIYFDFAGYSDMAIGLGRIFGFQFLENFNFPYVSRSIQEFWRRWHISLSNWFRDYLYIPLGGNRKGPLRTYFNLFIVFLLTGFWHGAGWSFIFWGLFHGLFMIIERLGFDKVLAKLWRPIQHLYVLLVVIIAWVFFRIEDFGEAVSYTLNLFGFGAESNIKYYVSDYLNLELLIFTPFVILGSTYGLQKIYNKSKQYFNKRGWLNAFEALQLTGTFFLLFICILSVSMGTYNPFIYFRF